MNEHDVFDELAAAYALDALDGDDRRVFDAHLGSCAICQATVADLRRVGTSIGLGVTPAVPPPDVKAKTMARATGRVMSETPRRVTTPARATGWSIGWLATAAAAFVAVAASVYAWSVHREVQALQAALDTASATVKDLRAELMTERQDAARLLRTVNIVGAPDVIRVDLQGAGSALQASGRAYWSRTEGLVFNADQLPGLDTGHIYQLWVIPSGAGATPVSAGLFTVDAKGHSPTLSTTASAVPAPAVVAVTIEPAGGSIGPTTTPILAGKT